MKQLIFVLALCVTFPSVSFAASIEQERMQGSIRQEQAEQQHQVKQQVEEYNKMVNEVKKQPEQNRKTGIINVPDGYFICPKTGKLTPIGK